MTGDHYDAGGSKHFDAGSSNQNNLLRLTLYKKETARLLKESDYLHEGVMASLKDWAEHFHGKLPVEKEVDPISKEWQLKCDGLKLELLTLKEKNDIEERKLKLELAEVMQIINSKESDAYMETMKNLQDQLADAKHQLIQRMRWMKKLRNSIVDLKGNIRVMCRVRAVLPDDTLGQYESVISYPTSLESRGRCIELSQSGNIHHFTFDNVFGGDASQQDVFGEVSELIQSVLDGYKVCIFSYGQTGSGKTYTMMGKSMDDPDQKGLIPRSLEKIFQATQSLSAQGREYKMQVSVLEIYKESIHDLLATNQSIGSNTVGIKSSVRGKQQIPDANTQNKLKNPTIVEANENTLVKNLTIVDVYGMKEISTLLEQAERSRIVGRTRMNDRSSRSHMVFTLRISGVNEGNEEVQGVLNLIDLAGSERPDPKETNQDRTKEAQAINTSLLYLGIVIRELAEKSRYVSFRYSKLTRILQPYLGGDSKTVMFVNITPNPSSAGESLCSLNFADTVKCCAPQQRKYRLPDNFSMLKSG